MAGTEPRVRKESGPFVIIPVMALFLLLLPAVLGGSLARLAGVQLLGTRPLVAALVVQFIVLQAFSDPGPVLRPVLQALHVATYVVAAWFLWRNRRVPGLGLIGLGAASNGVTIAINGGTLPARPGALRMAHLAVSLNDYANSAALSHPRLGFLGDVFAIPGDWPLANVFSAGDVLILGGVALASLWICGTAISQPWAVPTRFQRPTPRVRSYPKAYRAFVFPDAYRQTSQSADLGVSADLGSTWH